MHKKFYLPWIKLGLNRTFSETDLDHSDAEIQIRVMKEKLDMRKREQAKLKKQLKKSENNYEKQRELKGKAEGFFLFYSIR